jgi:DNA repair exonuclease SbcCD nuclease subunit
MVKKIIHAADIHIRTFRMHDEYKEIFQEFINKCEDLATGYAYDEVRIAIVGDLVHQKITISNEQLMLGCWFLNQLSKIAPLVVVAGNHDLLENNKDRLDSISPMIQLLDNDKIRFYKDSECYLDDNIVWCNYSIFEENERPDIEAARAKHGDDKTYIGLYHAPIIGAKTDIGYEFDEHHTALEHFEGNDMVLLGDIHKRQSFNHQGIPIAYPSSLIQQGFGEKVSKHGFLFWDVKDKSYDEIDIPTRYGFYQFKITSLDDLEEGKEEHTNA